jgi:protein-L-isoaspartate(D-aspartate) O-methyltransferase
MRCAWESSFSSRGAFIASKKVMDHFKARRHGMVKKQIRARGIENPALLEALKKVPREAFLPDTMKELAYADSALPIDEGQTISQPYIVALMIDALDLNSGAARVLEIGTGSGYSIAVLSHLAKEVYGIERNAALYEKALERLSRLGYGNIHLKLGDGSLGWSEQAPFDGILVTASGPKIPDSLLQQLNVGASLVMPVGPKYDYQVLGRVKKVGDGEYLRENLGDVKFVPLIGDEAWQKNGPGVLP